MTIRAATYGRQSHGDNTSIGEQLDIGRKRVEEHVWQLVAALQDGKSASRHGDGQRDDWAKLLQLVGEDKLDLVWLWEASRGDRTASTWLAFLELCRDHHVVLYIDTDDYAYDLSVARDWKAMATAGVDSAYESDLIQQRTMREKNRARRTGDFRRVLGGRARYGWRDEPDGWVVDADQATVLQEVAKRVLADESLLVVYRELTQDGPLLDSYGRALSYHRLRSTLAMPITAGLMTESAPRQFSKNGRRRKSAGGGKVIRRAADGPLDEDTWRALQVVFAGRSAGRPYGNDYSVARLLRCSNCGNQLNGDQRKGVAYYRCKTPHPNLGVHQPCYGTSIRTEVVHDMLRERMATWASDSPRAKHLAEQQLGLGPKRKALRQDKARLDKRQANLDYKMDRGRYSQADYDRNQAALDADYERIERELATVAEAEAQAVPVELDWDHDEAEDKLRFVAEVFQTPIVVQAHTGTVDQRTRLDPQLR